MKANYTIRVNPKTSWRKAKEMEATLTITYDSKETVKFEGLLKRASK